MIVRTLLAASLALLQGVAMAVTDFATGEAVAVMPMPADARAQLYPAVGYDGRGTYLVVWQQGRFYHQSQHADILAVRIDTSGRVLDREPIVICSVEASQERPQVAFSGGTFLVVWHDLRNGRNWDVYAARVSPDGSVKERNGFLVSGGSQNQASPVVTPTDDGFLVVWQHYDRHYRLLASTIPAADRAPAAPPQPLKFRGEALWGGGLALARVGKGWLMSWNDEKAWSKSNGTANKITRRFARLVVRGEAEVLEVQRSPSFHLGRSGGLFVSDGASRALYAGWAAPGKGGTPTATAALFDAGQALPLKNPNSERVMGWSGWNTERMITPYNAEVPVDGPVAAAFGQGMYLVAAQEAHGGKSTDRNRLLGARLTATGLRIDKAPAWPILHESSYRIANPVLAAGHRQFLLAFEQEDVPGRRQIWIKILKAE